MRRWLAWFGEKGRSAMPDRRGQKNGAGLLTVALPQFIAQGDDLTFREFVADLFAAVAAMQSLRRAISGRHGLGSTELAVLLAVWQLGRQGPVGVRAVAQHLHVAAPHATAEIRGLVKRGLLTKETDPDDTRAVRLTLTKAGQELLSELAPTLRSVNDELFAELSVEEMISLRVFFAQLIAKCPGLIAELEVAAVKRGRAAER
jgi:MarR family transcriptional regulator, organic hydroperoxide resistance regulator